MPKSSICPECGNSSLYSSGGVSVVACKDCGLTRFFAASEARAKLSQSDKWHKV